MRKLRSLLIIFFALILTLPDNNNDFQCMTFCIVCLVFIGFKIIDIKTFLDYVHIHYIDITEEGFRSQEKDGYFIVPWKDIVSVKKKIKNNKISNLSLETTTGLIDLTHYENIEHLIHELRNVKLYSIENNPLMFWIKTVLFSIVSIVSVFVSAYFFANLLSEFIYTLLHAPTIIIKMLIDSIITFLIIFFIFLGLCLIKNIQHTVVLFSGAIFVFIFWGIESGAFLNGLNPMYPAWYEINMAINDIVAAFLALSIKKHYFS